MKKISWIALLFCFAWFAGCKDEPTDVPENPDATDQIEEIFAGVYINNSPSQQPTIVNQYPIGRSTNEDDFGSIEPASISLKSTQTVHPNDDGSRGYDYRFKLVGEYQTLEVTLENGAVVETQATHIKITSDAKYAFVSYNTKDEPCHGGVVVFDVSNIENPKVVSTLMTSSSEFSAVDYDESTRQLYAAGSTFNPQLGYKDDASPAFAMMFVLETNMKFKSVAPAYVTLTSFQATSLKLANNQVYITTGDGTGTTPGGLYIYDKELKTRVNFVSCDNARSVDVDEAGNVYVMQAEYARITKYNANGQNPVSFYSQSSEAQQHHAKSEITVWNSGYQTYVLSAENESGMRMLASNGSVYDKLVWPSGSDLEKHVTNSVALNCDKKSYMTEGTYFNSNLLLLANGEKGIYWYDIQAVSKSNTRTGDKIVVCNTNSISFGDGLSANYIASRGNVVFVADGMGGLKILSITVDNGKPDDPEPESACTTAYESFYNIKNTASLFPEGKSVFRSDAAGPVKTLFSAANVDKVMKSIKVTNKTNLYISYMHEGAGFKNALAFYVTPEGQNTPEYFQSNVNKEGKFYTTKNGVRVVNDEYIILPNVSDISEGGPLSQGQMFRIVNYATADGSFNEGDEVVLVLVQDGWSAQNSRVQTPSTTNTWQLPVFLNYDVLRGMIPTSSTWYSSSTASGEPYNSFKGIQHCAFYTGDCNTIVIAFEDKYNGTDTDYNDIIFTVTDKSDGTGGGVMNIEKPYFTMNPGGELVPTNP